MNKIYLACLFAAFSFFGYASNLDISLTNVEMKKTTIVNNSVEILGTILNNGSETIHSFEVILNSGSTIESKIISDVEILSGQSYTFSFGAFTPTEAKRYHLEMMVTNPNGQIDTDFSNNIRNQDLHSLLKTAVKRAVAEEATGTWCGWCPRGAVFMEDMADEYGDLFIPIAVHNSDPMENSTYDAAIGGEIAGYPSVVLDRYQVIDPSALPGKIPARLDNDAVVELQVIGTYDAAEEVLNVTVIGMFLEADDELDYRYNIILTENEVTGTTSGYNQSNYYAGGGYGEMGGYEDLGSSVPAAQMVYQFVAREIYDGWEGTEESVPVAVTAGEYISYTYEIDIDSDWDLENLNVIAIMTDHNDDDEIINGISAKILELDPTAIEVNTNSFDIDVYPNPANELTYVRAEFETPVALTMQITDMNGKVIATKNYGMTSGNIALPINTSEFASGIYIATIIADGKISTEKLNIVH